MPQPGLPDAEVSVAAKAAEVAKMREVRRTLDALTADVDAQKAACDHIEASIAELEARLVHLREQRVRHAADHAESVERANELARSTPTPEAIADAETAMSTLETTNAAVRQAAAWRELSAEVANLTRTAKASESAVSEARAAKLALLASAKLPIDGLVVTDDGQVAYEGVGLHELSEGQKLVVGCAIAIATRGSLSAVFVDGGESIDAANEAKAVAMCEAAGVTLIIAETVKSAGELVIRGASWSRVEGEAGPEPA